MSSISTQIWQKMFLHGRLERKVREKLWKNESSRKEAMMAWQQWKQAFAIKKNISRNESTLSLLITHTHTHTQHIHFLSFNCNAALLFSVLDLPALTIPSSPLSLTHTLHTHSHTHTHALTHTHTLLLLNIISQMLKWLLSSSSLSLCFNKEVSKIIFSNCFFISTWYQLTF